MKDPMYLSGDDIALDKPDYEQEREDEINDAESAWEMANDR